MTHSHSYSSKKNKKNPVVHISSNSLYKWHPEQELAAGGTSTVCECQFALPASLSGPPWQRPPATCLWACSTSPCSPGGHASVPAPSCPASCRWQHRQANLIMMIYFTQSTWSADFNSCWCFTKRFIIKCKISTCMDKCHVAASCTYHLPPPSSSTRTIQKKEKKVPISSCKNAGEFSRKKEIRSMDHKQKYDMTKRATGLG